MADLWDVLGYDRKILETLEDLQRNPLVLIEGPPGVGKSWLARGVAEMWEGGGGAALIAEGDGARSSSDFYPFGLALSRHTKRWKRVAGVTLTSTVRLGEAALPTGGALSAMIADIAKLRRELKHERMAFLGEREHAILSELESMAHGKPILLVADNMHWWDAASLGFLPQLLDPKMSGAFPFLAGLRVLAVQTEAAYQRVAHPAPHARMITIATPRHRLAKIGPEGFSDVLVALGAGDPPAREVADVVHAMTGGHLALAGLAIRLIGENDLRLSGSDQHPPDELRTLVLRRIVELGDVGTSAIGLLQTAALLGLACLREELICASPKAAADTAEILRRCRDERLLDFDGRLVHFAHDAIRQILLSTVDAGDVGIYARLVDCLTAMRPAAYSDRCVNAWRAGDVLAAETLAVQAAIEQMRESHLANSLLPEVENLLAGPHLAAIVDRFRRAFASLRGNRYDACLEQLDLLPRSLPRPLRAEADYLRGICLLSTRSEDLRAEARAILSPWLGYEAEEPELGVRLARQMLFGLSQQLDKTPARSLEQQIQTALADRAERDESARDELYVLDRCSGALSEPEVSLVRYRRAVRYFAPSAGYRVVRRPVEYYRCLSNLVAKLVSVARYDEACEVAETLSELISAYEPGIFPRPDFVIMNRALAEYRAGIADAGEVEMRLRRLIDTLDLTGDLYYAGNAHAVFLALAGRTHEAVTSLEDLREMLASRSRTPVPSISYLLGANLAAARSLLGEDVTDEWARLRPVLEAIPYVVQPILVRRHDLLAEFFETSTAGVADALDTTLLARAEFGPLWNNFGRGFRLPELEFWQDS